MLQSKKVLNSQDPISNVSNGQHIVDSPGLQQRYEKASLNSKSTT